MSSGPFAEGRDDASAIAAIRSTHDGWNGVPGKHDCLCLAVGQAVRRSMSVLGPRLLVQFLFDSAPTGPCWRVPDRLVATGPGAVVVGTLTGYHHLLMGNSRR